MIASNLDSHQEADRGKEFVMSTKVARRPKHDRRSAKKVRPSKAATPAESRKRKRRAAKAAEASANDPQLLVRVVDGGRERIVSIPDPRASFIRAYKRLSPDAVCEFVD